MPAESSPEAERDFFTVACDLSMITADVAAELTEEATSRSVAPAQLVMQRGLLTPVQVDIVDTMMRPRHVIPGYVIESVLGHGGMGVVYRARQQNLDRVVALKTVLVSQMSDVSAAARFEQEAIAVARLRHPNIVGAYDFGQHDGRLFFAMEFVEGKDLDRLIHASGGLDESLAWNLARQAAAGLAHAAAAGIVHRDIKPANLLLVEAPEGFPLPAGVPMVKIADFGLAFLSNEVETKTRLTSANTTLGSPHYMAPEQLSNERVDFHSDIYALGATVFHMLAGKPPFHGLTLTQTVTQKLAGHPPSLRDDVPGVSLESERLVLGMMQPDRGERPREYGELLRKIDELANAGGSSSPASVQTTAIPMAGDVALPDQREPQTTAAVRGGQVTMAVDESSHSAAPGKTRPRWQRPVAATVMVAIIAAAAVVLWTRDKPDDPIRSHLDVARSEILYDGQSTRGWTPESGGWDQDGRQIHCDGDGVYRRGLPDFAQYRITTIVTLGSAADAEIHFGLQKQAGLPRYVVQISAEGVALGLRPHDDGALHSLSEVMQVENVVGGDHDVIIERQPQHWFVYFDEKLVGWLPIDDAEYLPELRLAVHGGEAWFSAISIDELVRREVR